MIEKKDRSVRGSIRWVHILMVTLLATPVAATLARRPTSGAATATVAVQKVGAAQARPKSESAVSEVNPNEIGDIAPGTDNQEEGGMTFEESSYAVVCCYSGDTSACTYYIGANKCPGGTSQMSCPCRQTHD